MESIFANRLQEARKAKGMSQYRLAADLNISRSAVSMYEQGIREPSLGTVERISEILDISIDYLIGRSDEPNSKKHQGVDGFVSGVSTQPKCNPIVLTQVDEPIGARFSDRFTQMRNLLGLSQNRVAETLNTTLLTIRFIESGKWEPIGESIKYICSKLKLPADYFDNI